MMCCVTEIPRVISRSRLRVIRSSVQLGVRHLHAKHICTDLIKEHVTFARNNQSIVYISKNVTHTLTHTYTQRIHNISEPVSVYFFHSSFVVFSFVFVFAEIACACSSIRKSGNRLSDDRRSVFTEHAAV